MQRSATISRRFSTDMLCPATEHFDTYAEPITGESGEGGETTALLHKLAKDTKKWLIGGSIPERDNDGKLYNTS